MTDKEKIRTEIERLLNEPSPSHDSQCNWKDGYWCALYKIEEFIDSLQEDPVSIWHNANQPPEINTPIIVRTYDNIIESTKRYDDKLIPWDDRIKKDGITHWCYVEDLLKL